ncbi:MAG TPA: glycoside hydrolase family 15 protein [Deltaproteobacteria bacterium]|nr:glycoside hydrolase family 15 protein [Deltaproteobacteria bacterium]
MPRDLPLGNGKLLVCFDMHYCIRDLYFPHVGQENHAGGNYFRIGVWADGDFSWVGPDWECDLRYMPDTLSSQVTLAHTDLGIRLLLHDTVDFHENIFIREITIENMRPDKREVRLFFTQDFDISGNSIGDTAAYDPKTDSIVHYKGDRYFIISGMTEKKGSLYQFATGQKMTGDREGTFRDAQDGVLSGNPIAQGSVDSVVSLSLSIRGNTGASAYYWIGAGKSWGEVRVLDAIIRERHPKSLIRRTEEYWHLWVYKETPCFDMLTDRIVDAYRRSLLILRTQIDWQGGIVAANDSDVILYNRDTYSYVWPRDGALIAHAMDAVGYVVVSQNFYRFVSEAMEREGYLLHKYNPDGTLASSWHPWFENGKESLPIQEDETALVVWALWQHFVLYRNIEFIKPLYRPLIKRTGDFMSSYLDTPSGLPGESYDLWEERRGILSFTTGTVFGGLTAASLFCTVFGEHDKALEYQRCAAKMRDAASQLLFREELGCFARMIHRNDKGDFEVDSTLDASLWALFAFGMYSVNDPRIVSTMNALRERLWVKTDIGGMARYENDPYHRVSSDVPGNPWFICTLWYADYLIERAKTEKDLEGALNILTWVADHALPSGVLAEQVHPFTGQPLSVSPLTWSHATFVATINRFIKRLHVLQDYPGTGLSLIEKARREDWIGKLYKEACDTIHDSCKT